MQCTLQMTSLPERDLALPFPEPEASMSVRRQEWCELVGGSVPVLGRGEEMWKGDPETASQPASGAITGAGGVRAAPSSAPLSQPGWALGGARLFGGGECVHEGWVRGDCGGGRPPAHVQVDCTRGRGA